MGLPEEGASLQGTQTEYTGPGALLVRGANTYSRVRRTPTRLGSWVTCLA